MSPGAEPSGRRTPRRGRRTAGEDPIPLSEALGALSDRLGGGSARIMTAVFGHWEEIVGPAIAAHVQPLRLNGEAMLLGVDHPAWATQVRQLAPEILGRLREVCGEDDVPTRLEVRVQR